MYHKGRELPHSTRSLNTWKPTIRRSNTVAITDKLSTSSRTRTDSSSLTSPTKIIRDKLQNLATSFTGFKEKVTENKRRIVKRHESKLIDIKKDLSRINKSFQLECKTRDEEIKSVAHSLDMKIKKTKSFIEIPINKKIAAIAESIEYLSNKMDDIERRENVENERIESMINESYSKMMKQFEEYESELHTNCMDYQEKQRILERIINEQQNKIKRFIRTEKEERDAKIQKLHKAIDKEMEERLVDNEQIRVYLAENLEKLDGRIAESEKERQDTTDQVVAALCHYTTTLQDGVQIVTSANN